jgi:hypothetical protein
MVAKVILAIAAAAFVGSGRTDVWARGGKGGHGGGMRSAWMGKNTQGVHGKSGRRHFPRQMQRSHGHDQHKKKQQHHRDFAQGVWQKASGKQSDFRRNWQGGSGSGGGGDGYGGSVGDVCINSQFCQGVWYQVTKSPTSSESSASYQRNPQPIDK